MRNQVHEARDVKQVFLWRQPKFYMLSNLVFSILQKFFAWLCVVFDVLLFCGFSCKN